jgi:hypothetical protein
VRSEKTTQPFGGSSVVTSLKKTGTDATFFFAPVKAGTVGGGGDVENECGPKLDGGNFRSAASELCLGAPVERRSDWRAAGDGDGHDLIREVESRLPQPHETSSWGSTSGLFRTYS